MSWRQFSRPFIFALPESGRGNPLNRKDRPARCASIPRLRVWENKSRIIESSPDLLVTECRYFEASKYEETEDRYHVHFQDLLEIQKELPHTTIAIAHVSRTYQDISPLVKKAEKNGFIFARRVLFYEDSSDYEIIEGF